MNMSNKKKIKLGLKLWSTNDHYFKEACRLWEEGVFDFIELTAVCGSYEQYARLWKTLKVPYIIHGPTYNQDFSLADPSKEKENRRRFADVQRYADLLEAPIIILHPGVEGDLNETARQLNLIQDKRIAIENKPYFVKGDLVCNGYLPEHLAFLKQSCGVKLCFDIGHAKCAANALKLEHLPFIKKFLDLKPDIFHLLDGYEKGIYDEHINLGEGEFNFNEILPLYPKNCMITLETAKKFRDNLSDFENDVNFLRGVLSNTHVI